MSSHKKNQVSNPKNGFKNHKGRITAGNSPPPLTYICLSYRVKNKESMINI